VQPNAPAVYVKELRLEKDKVEKRICEVAEEIASDLGLQMDKSIRMEWYKVSNTRTRCMRITQVIPPPLPLSNPGQVLVGSRQRGRVSARRAVKAMAEDGGPGADRGEEGAEEAAECQVQHAGDTQGRHQVHQQAPQGGSCTAANHLQGI